MTLQSIPQPPPGELIRRYEKSGPRYTSYPPAPNWSADYGASDFARALQTSLGRDEISLYLHIPFCERRCSFCACNVIISRDHSQGLAYVDLLTKEMDLALATAGTRSRLRVVQLHLGGGTPTWLAPAELDLLYARLAQRFELLPEREQSIEVHPVVTTREHIDVLRRHGLTRLSMGVQDFNPNVQRIINRDQTFEQTESLIRYGRSLGIAGINVDLIYGLPLQTLAGFNDTLSRVIALGIDRMALYNFAYLPERVQGQKVIDPATLPPADMRLELFMLALRRFAEAGYRQIGLDHFARDTDELATALDDGTLQRNFMGYTTRAGRDLLSFGLSSISRVGRDFAQNVKEPAEYRERLAAGELPVERGLRLSDDDLLREHMIQHIMCFGRVDVAGLSAAAGRDLVAENPRLSTTLQPLIADRLVDWDGHTLAVTALGRYFLRNIAMAFDAYLGKPLPPTKLRTGKLVETRFSQTV